MAPHERFRFKSRAELEEGIRDLGLDIQLQDDLSPLRRPVQVGNLRTPNALGIHPMEGSDGDADGSPGELTARRYRRFAGGGAGLLWFEATAVLPEARANPRQLWLHSDNVGKFAALVREAATACAERYGPDYRPVTVLQLTHSGRVSRPVDKPAPIIAFHNPLVEQVTGLPADYPVIGDDELERLEDRYVAAALLAREAGFDAVDLKATHGYLVYELLAAHTRPGRYGGPFENRTRMLLNIVRKVRDAVPDLTLAVRLGFCDGLRYPYAWGMSREVPGEVDFAEPVRLVRLLYAEGVRLLSVSAGIGRFKSHMIQPFDQWSSSQLAPDEHPLEGVARLFRAARAAQEAEPRMVVMGSGYTWLRQYFPFAAAANLSHGGQQIAGVGRMAFAYPEFARDLLEKGMLEPRKVCTTCSKCTFLMRDGGTAGCVTRDKSVYLPIYKLYCV